MAGKEIKNLKLRTRTPRGGEADDDAVTETGYKMNKASDVKKVGMQLAEQHEAVRKLTAYMASLNNGKGLAKDEVLVWNVETTNEENGIDTQYLSEQSLRAFNDDLVLRLKELNRNFDENKRPTADRKELKQSYTPVWVGPNLRKLLEFNSKALEGMPSLSKHNVISRANIQSLLYRAAHEDKVFDGDSGNLLDISGNSAAAKRWRDALEAPALKTKVNGVRVLNNGDMSTLDNLKADDDEKGNPTFRHVTEKAIKAAPTKGREAKDAVDEEIRVFEGLRFNATNFYKIIADNTLSIAEVSDLNAAGKLDTAQKATVKYLLDKDGNYTKVAVADIIATQDKVEEL